MSYINKKKRGFLETPSIFSFVIFSFILVKKKSILSPTMAPVNKGSNKRKHRSLAISEKVELLEKT